MTTAPDQQTFDQILEQTFPKDIQQKRIRKELISLNDLDQNYYKINLQNSSLGLKVVVEFTELFIQREIQQNSNLQHPIILELLLDPQFPFNLPKLFCRTNIFQPSLADGRDFLEDAIERPWSPTILLREVITSIPTFLKKVIAYKTQLTVKKWANITLAIYIALKICWDMTL
jgi:ubiquitin-protein ligase